MSKALADHVVITLGTMQLPARRTVDDMVNDPDYWLDTNPVRYSELFDECQAFWTGQHLDSSWERGLRSRKVQFSRVLQRLLADKLVWGLALAWVNVEDEIVFRWQGGGRTTGPADMNTPRIKMVSLTDAGWERCLLLHKAGETT